MPHSYDMIIASNVLHATPSLEETLANTRKLLRPGGHLVIIEVTHYEHWRVGFMFGIFADWWAGAHEGRVFEPFVSIDKWDELMRKTGFSGIDCRSADPDSRIYPNSVFSTHAVSDEIDLLWNPLGSSSPSTVPSTELVIVGTATPRTAKIVEGLRQFLPQGRTVRTLKTLQEVNDADDVAPKSTFLVLSELQGELFDNFDQDKLEAMQMMFATASHVLWVTEDAWVTNTNQAMSIGLLRTLRLEYIDVQIQCLDIDNIDAFDPKILAEQLVRLESGSTWEEDGLLWTQEPELYLVKGKLTMQRLRSDIPRNHRLNADRRPILEKADSSQTAVSLCQNDEEVYLKAHDKAGRLPDSSSKHAEVDDTVEAKLRFVSAKAFRVGNAGGFYHIAQGITSDSKAVVVLTDSNVSLAEVPRKRVFTLSSSLDTETCVLPAVMADLVAQNIVTSCPVGTTALLFDPPAVWIDAVLRRAEKAGVHVRIASTSPPPADGLGKDVWIRLHESETKRGLANKLPLNLSSFFDFSSDTASRVSLGGRLASLLSASCSVYHLGHLVQDKAAPLSSSESAPQSTAFSLLQQAVEAAESTTASLSLPRTSISVSQVAALEQLRGVDLVVRWDVENVVSARVRPIDSTPLFVNDKTYLLVGLAGDLGRSIARWMVLHGARHVVLSSRYPRIDQQWIDDVTALGGNIMALPMDASSEASVDAGLAKIRASMPTIAGVAFGPLVLQDIMFKNMDLEMMQMVLAPKVIGARLLDERLTDPLDFFVMFSSFVMVSGNPGQAAYSAASAFTHALANARRARGLAASTIDIGAVYGVGFVTRAGREEEYDVVKFMFDTLDEQELQTLFAEGVVAGRAKTTDSVEVVTGMPSIDPANRDRIPYYNDPRLSYFKLPTGHGGSDGNDATAVGSVKDRLQVARDIEEIREIITGRFSIDGSEGNNPKG